MRVSLGFLGLVVILIAPSVLFAQSRGDANKNAKAAQTTQAPLTVTRIYTGADGRSHAEQIDVKFDSDGRGRERSDMTDVKSWSFRRYAAGFADDWHPASERRWLVTLSGRGEIELRDGQKIQAVP